MPMDSLRWHEYDDIYAVASAAAAWILRAAAAAIAARGAFHLVLAGGTTPRLSYRLLAQTQAAWQHWHVYFGDERCLPPDSPDRNSFMATQVWLNQVAVLPAHIYPIPAEIGASQAAARYDKIIQAVRPFDLVLLGMGEDGHTASLFPGHQHDEQENVHAVFDAPKPPPQRVSLSAATLADSRAVLYLITGAGKYPALCAWRSGQDLPVARIRPACGVDILLDQAARTGIV
jgi:6-phosphogluconolactonase